MIRPTPEDFVRLPATEIAQLMLQCTSDDPSLVRRSRGHAKSIQIPAKLLPPGRHEPSSPLTLLSSSDSATKQYLEDLVAIAVASAERADDVLHQARVTRRKTARAMWAFASIAAVSGTVGIVSVVGGPRSLVTDHKLTEIAGQVRSLGERQQQASQQLAAVRSAITDERDAVAVSQQTAPPPPQDVPSPRVEEASRAIPVRPSQPIVTAPVDPVQRAIYSSPWPVHSQSVRPSSSMQTAWSTQHRQVFVPRFLLVIQQNLRTLFR